MERFQKGNKDFKIFPEKVLTMVFDCGKVNISNEREVSFMNMEVSVIESIIIRKVEFNYSEELSKLSKDMACPIMLIRKYVRTCCENNDMMGMLNESVWENICNFLYEKYVK